MPSSWYQQLRALLVVAMIAVVGLSAAVVILANDQVTSTSITTTPIASINSGDLNPATGVTASPSTRYDGGPDEGTRGPLSAPASASLRYDGGPEEGSRGNGH